MKKTILIFVTLMQLLFAYSTKHPLKIREFKPQSSSNNIEICAQFNRYFEYLNSSELKKYIKLIPTEEFSVKSSYKKICIGNLKPQTTYKLIFNKNMPLSGVGLDRDYNTTLKSGNYAPSLSFKESGYILPAKGDITIPLTSRNIKKVKVGLYRINRNNLINTINSTDLKSRVSRWELDDIDENIGYHLWDKNLTINGKINQKITTAIPVGDVLKKYQSGVYILAVYPYKKDGSIERYEVSTQWFMVSDVGVYTLKGLKKFHIYTKHLSSAKPYNGVKIEIISKNNELLATTTSKDGYASIDSKLLNGKKGMRAKALYAYGENGDFSILNLSTPPIDLTDRGDGGAEPIKNYDAYIFANRGIFKPNETITAHILVKDAEGKAVKNLKASAKLIKPSGKKGEVKLVTTDDSGYASVTFKLPNRSGRYSIYLNSASNEPIGKLGFKVEDFIPPKIEAKIVEKPNFLSLDKNSTIKLKVKFLTGEPLPNPKIDITTILHTDRYPFKEFKDYHFGKIDEKKVNKFWWRKSLTGDSNGTIKIDIPKAPKSRYSKPMSLSIIINVKDPGGRAITKIEDIFINNKKGYIGIKPKFEYDAVDMDSKAIFNLIYISNLKPKAAKLHYKLIKEEAYWNWKKVGDSWRYYRVYQDERVQTKGSIDINSSVGKLELDKLAWGHYRLEIEDEFGDISSYRFSSGYDESSSKVSPDKLPILIDKKIHKSTEDIKVNITPKFSGPLIVSVASNQIFETKEIEAKAGESVELSFKVKKEWGSSIYILATSFRAQSKKLGSSRAIGLAHTLIIDSKNIINLELKVPKKVKSKSKLEVNIDSKDAEGNVSLIVFAVDRGVLSLTNFKTPNPADRFYTKRRLGIEIRDIYSELIKAYGEHAEFDVGSGEGGDIAPVEAINKPTANMRRVVALSSRVLNLKNGKANAIFDIPDFQGSLRVMAIAWSNDGVGAVDKKVTIKDPISTQLYMPRFLSKGDSANILLQANFDKDETPSGEYIFNIESNDIVDIEPKELKFNLDNNSLFTKRVKVKALKNGVATIKIRVTKSGKIYATREFKLATREPYPKTYVREVGILKSGSILDAKSAIDSKRWSGVSNISIKIQSYPILSIEAIKDELIDYCCRCAEQSASRGFGFLDDKSNSDIVEESIARLYELQKYDGSFGLWASSRSNLWLTSYDLDFLTEAKKRGFKVSNERLEKGLKYLQNSLNRWSNDAIFADANAYALYVLAKNKIPLISEINYHTNSGKSAISSASAWGFLAGALDILGEKKRAKEIFKLAINSINETKYYYSNYGGTLRDKAILTTLLSNANLKNMAREIYINLALDAKDKKYLSTQEMSWLIRANRLLEIKGSKLNININGKSYSGATYKDRFKSPSQLPNIKNLSKESIWYSVNYVATPNIKNLDTNSSIGFKIQKEYFTTKGKKIDLSNIAHGDEVVVVISGEITDSSIKQPIILDLLPAGLEIENPNITGYNTVESLSWIGKLTKLENEEFRDDRYIASPSEYSGSSFKVAYIARAVTKGKFKLSPALVSDMYKPHFRALSKNALFVEIKDAKDIKKVTPKVKEVDLTTIGKTLTSADFENIFNKKIGNLSKYSTKDLNILRNAIFAQAGLDYNKSNPMLHKLFTNFNWYKPQTVIGAVVYSKLTPTQKENVQLLLNEEKDRLGGLTLNDFYLVNTKELNDKLLKKYSKHDLKILRNSLIARYGYDFKDKKLRSIFNKLSWYKPNKDINTSEIIDTKMNKIQRGNLDKILKAEKGDKWGF